MDFQLAIAPAIKHDGVIYRRDTAGVWEGLHKNVEMREWVWRKVADAAIISRLNELEVNE